MIDTISIGPYQVVLLDNVDGQVTVKAIFRPNPIQRMVKSFVIPEDKWLELCKLASDWKQCPLDDRVITLMRNGFAPVTER